MGVVAPGEKKNPLKHEGHVFNIAVFTFYITINVIHFPNKNESVNIVTEIISVHCANHIGHINVLSG